MKLKNRQNTIDRKQIDLEALYESHMDDYGQSLIVSFESAFNSHVISGPSPLRLRCRQEEIDREAVTLSDNPQKWQVLEQRYFIAKHLSPVLWDN